MFIFSYLLLFYLKFLLSTFRVLSSLQILIVDVILKLEIFVKTFLGLILSVVVEHCSTFIC